MVKLTYIATFFTHFAAVNFSRQLKGTEKKPMLMPVPRKLSSSCGTCVKFILDSDIQEFVHSGIFDEDVDTVYLTNTQQSTKTISDNGKYRQKAPDRSGQALLIFVRNLPRACLSTAFL